MLVRHLPCGSPINESERKAIAVLKAKLQAHPDHWLLLSNLQHHSNALRMSDELDLVLIGSRGALVVEVKHWDLAYLKANAVKTEAEAERLAAKTRRLAGKLREGRNEVGFVDARLLLTAGHGTGISGGQRYRVRGVGVYGLSECAELAKIENHPILSPQQLSDLAKLIEPTSQTALTGQLRQFGELINLQLTSPASEAFHRIYKGQHRSRRDKAILHLYDLSASAEKDPREVARREFDVIQKWQKSPFMPNLLDSFQEAEHYPGELYYFAIADSDAAALDERCKDAQWERSGRLLFAQESVRALQSFHEPDDEHLPALVHRSISPKSLRVRHTGKPLFVDFALSRLADAKTISQSATPQANDPWAAPEVNRGGLSAADARSDVYSLCKTLSILFASDHPTDVAVRALLSEGALDDPNQRASLNEVASALERQERPETPKSVHVDLSSALPAARFWDEGTIVPFNETRYKVLSRIGEGGIGYAFKVVELDVNSDERFGTYVAKVISNKADAEIALRAYRKARAHTVNRGLSTIHEIAPEWRPNCFAALLKWVEGVPLDDYTGVLSVHAEDLNESEQSLILRWGADLCEALWKLHEVGLIHGDVNPKNIIVEGGNVVLTDYDTVVSDGERPRTHHAGYSSESVATLTSITPSDDLYSLAASLFHVVFEREPFLFGSTTKRDQGLNWDGIAADSMPRLREFLDRATHPDSRMRFANAYEALVFLRASAGSEAVPADLRTPPQAIRALGPQVVGWLGELLSAYPGSRLGNAETRGLDSEFAVQTYVPTKLDQILSREVQHGKAQLVVLYGNAGDGKTAFLQQLVRQVSDHTIASSQRLFERKLKSGRTLRVNLDGSAAYENRSANEILDDFLRPFHRGVPSRDAVHAIAINSGKMLEWLDGLSDETTFTNQLRQSLFNDVGEPPAHLRLIDLNRRSLVGGIDQGQIGTQFLDALIDRFLGREMKTNPWEPCQRCSAQHRCAARASVEALRDQARGPRIRKRLADALQACHMRGEIHITARELRAALVFIFFGVNDCQELHDEPDLLPTSYWDRAFDAASSQRQGELLTELARLDPALDSDSVLDRQLVAQYSPGAADLAQRLASERRRAYFEWEEDQFAQLQVPMKPLSLHGARHLRRFREVSLMTAQQRRDLCQELCEGIARMEDLPELAYGRAEGLPLRLTPRTPTESVFWVLKPRDRFELEPSLPPAAEGLEVLHTHVLLSYQYKNGNRERLAIGLELFHLLLELKEGMRLSGVGQEGIFANLEIFVQRLSQEDGRELWGWHPEAERTLSRLHIEPRDDKQILIRESEVV